MSSPGRHMDATSARTCAHGIEPSRSVRVASNRVSWLTERDDVLRTQYERLYFPRNDPRFLRRNAVVAAGAGREYELKPEIEALVEGDDELVAEHALWALERLK
jgi:epoxyqueuosine reductase QueG